MVDPGRMAAARGSSGSREVVRPGFEAHYHVSLLTVRLPGGDNATADALSSNELFQQAPTVCSDRIFRSC